MTAKSDQPILSCLECSIDIYPSDEGYEEEVCPKHFKTAKAPVTYSCPSCQSKVAKPGECRVCISTAEFREIFVAKHLGKLGVPPRTAEEISFAITNGCVLDRPLMNKSLYFHGPPGSGKTFKACQILYHYLERYRTNKKHFDPKKMLRFITVPELLNKIRQSFVKPVIDDGHGNCWTAEEEIMEHYKLVDVLVLDDLGVEKTTDWSFMTLYIIINFRYEHKKTTIFTSNCTLEELAERLTDSRLTSRIGGWCELLQFEDKDYR